MTWWAARRITDGTGQDERLPPPLAPGYFVPDERSFAQLLSQSAELARVLRFHGAAGRAPADWGEFLLADETTIIALVIGTDTRRLAIRFERAAAAGPAAALDVAYRTARQIEFWRQRLALLPGRAARELEERVASTIRTALGQPLERLERLAPSIAPNLDFAVFGTGWRGTAAAAAVEQSPDTALRACFAAFVNGIDYLRSLARPYLEESLQTQDHDPALGLFLAFLGLYGGAQQRLNRFTQRHLDFYYREVLAAAPRPAAPDRALLALARPSGTAPLRLPKGTPFVFTHPGSPASATFRATSELWLSSARVAALATLCLDHDRHISPERELGYVTRLRAGSQPVGPPVEGQRPWPLFGSALQPGLAAPDTATGLGFAIASPGFLLREGRRRVDVTVTLHGAQAAAVEPGTNGGLLDEIEAAGSAAELSAVLGRLFRRTLLTRGAALEGAVQNALLAQARRHFADPAATLAIEELFGRGADQVVLADKLLAKAFDLALTTADGWLPVENGRIRLAPEPGTMGLRLTIVLEPAAPAIAGYDPAVHGGALPTRSPLLRCVLGPCANFCAYSLFAGLTMRSVVIETAVEGLRDLQVANQDGPVDATKPFFPFGARPNVGAYLMFGGSEIARKKLIRLAVRLSWNELPAGIGGFAEHYAGYERAYSRADFTVAPSVLRDGTWHAAAAEPLELFPSPEPGEGLKATTRTRIPDLAPWRATEETEAAKPFALQNGTRSGFFRLALTGPEGAFGHRAYPVLFAEALARRLRTRRVKHSLPKEPYTPLVAAIEVDYAARTVLLIDQGRSGQPPRPGEAVFHLHPNGHEEAFPVARRGKAWLLPHYEHAGNLLIGIAGHVPGSPLTLLFEAAEETHGRAAVTPPPVVWTALAADGWRRFEPWRVLADTTSGLMTSGIVTLDVPIDLDTAPTALPAGLVWLRAAVDHHLGLFPGMLSVRAQGLEVERCEAEGAAGTIGEPLPPGGTWRPAGNLPGVADITRVGRSFSGRPKESRAEFHARLSERLRHKQRAVTAWDYERLVLERFPDIAKVKCFANMLSTSPEPAPGNLMVVVVPRPVDPEGDPGAAVMADVLQLQRINAFLATLAPPFARITVRNPTYERIQLRCRVRFGDGAGDGANIRRLQQDVSGFLSPWTQAGCRARFGWVVRCDDVQGFVERRDYVATVSDFSLLQLVEDDRGRYRLEDTARPAGAAATSRSELQPSYPWSLALPFDHHHIEAAQDWAVVEPEPTGVGELEVGCSFVVGGGEAGLD